MGIVISISEDIYNFYSNELKKNKKIVFHVENILTERSPFLNDNNDYVYSLPTQFIKGYVNYGLFDIFSGNEF